MIMMMMMMMMMKKQLAKMTVPCMYTKLEYIIYCEGFTTTALDWPLRL
jgi:hypothetical protein